MSRRLQVPEGYLSDREVAERLGKSWQYVQERCKSGAWPHVRFGRLYGFSEEQYQECLRIFGKQHDPAETSEESWGVKSRAS